MVFHWGPDCQDAFDRLKTLITTSPITAFPDFSLPFRLYDDASTAGLGAILAQVREGKECIICCASHSLNQAEKAYPATKLECLAIIWAVAKFRPYLMLMPFEVYTDHYELQWLKTMRTGPTLLHRWSAALKEYDFMVKHRPAIWFLLPSDGFFRHSSSSLQYYLTHQGRRMVLRGGDVARPPLECHLNWVPDPDPNPPRDHSKENHPPAAEPRKLPKKIRPQTKRKEHHHHPGTSGSVPGTSQPPRCSMSTPVKHLQPPQLSQHPQPPPSAANQNSSRPNLLDQAELGRLHKLAHSSLNKESTTRSRRDYFSGSNLSFSSKRSHQDFSGSPSGHTKRNQSMNDPLREAISVSWIARREETDPAQTPPCAALPDVAIDVGADPPEAAATSRIPHADHPPVVLEISSSSQEPSEPHRCPDAPGKWFRPPARGQKRMRTSSPPPPRRPRKRPSATGRW